MHRAIVRLGLTVVLSLAAGSAAGCATYEQELQRAEEHFTHDEHERSLAGLRALETDWFKFGMRDRARYAYLRGMTDYRIGFKSDARHWLAIAAQIDRENPGALIPSERTLVDETLGELNRVVWAGDVLPTEEAPGAAPAKKPKAPPATDENDTPPKKDDGDKASPKDDDDSPKPKKKSKPSE